MTRLARFGRSALMVLALAAGTVAAPAASPVNPAWSADPDEQYLLDVNIRQLQLGEGVRAYQTPEGACVLLGDFLTALDVPMKIDLAAGRASGWAFKENYQISIDRSAKSVRYGGATETLSPGAVREVPEGWCVEVKALSRWFGLGITANTGASVLLLESETKLPVELAKERRDRAARIKTASFDLKGLPQVKLPYRLWRAPALDFVVNAGVTYDARTGAKLDRRAAIMAAGEIATLSYEARLGTNEKGIPDTFRFKAFRADPDAALLGPLKATTYAVGDVEGVSSALAGTGTPGRGAMITNQPLNTPAAFDRTSFSGELPAGWEAELYRNGELIAFSEGGPDRRYQFSEVQLLYGDNRFEIVSYGPQGQVRSRIDTLTVGPENVPPGKTWYWAGVVDPGHDLIDFRKDWKDRSDQGWRAAASVAHGLDKRTSVSALVQTLVEQDQRVTFVEGAVRRSVGPALVELAAARDTQGGMAFRGQALARLGSVSLSAQSIVSRQFRGRGEGTNIVGDHRLTVDAPLKLGSRSIPLHGDIRLAEYVGGDRMLEGQFRTSTMINRFNLATAFRYRRTFTSGGPAPPGELEMALIGSGRIGQVRVRGSTEWQIAPSSRLQRAELSGYWSATDNVDWEGGVTWDQAGRRANARLSHIRRFNALAVAFTGEAATDGSVAAGISLNFSLDQSAGRLRLSRDPLASAGSVRARVYRDLNANGSRDGNEPLEAGALITAGLRVSDRPTDRSGATFVTGLDNYKPVAIGIDESSLSDPNLVPGKSAQVVVPRPGVTATVEIGLVGGGTVEGVLVRSGGGGFEGLDVELVDASGRVAATTRSDFDGYFLFERVAYGKYRVRLAPSSAKAFSTTADLGPAFDVSEQRSVVRLGTLSVAPAPVLAQLAH